MAIPLVLGLTSGVFIALSLASIVFLCAVLIAAALMLRNRWNDIGSPRSGKSRSGTPRSRRP